MDMRHHVRYEQKEMEDEEQSLLPRKRFQYCHQKNKYPFHQYIDLEIDPAIKSVFADTFRIITKVLNENKPPQNHAIDAEYEAHDDVEQKYDHVMIHPKVKPQPPNTILSKSTPTYKYDTISDEEKEVEAEPIHVIFPLTESEIRKEMAKTMNPSPAKLELNAYEDRLIDAICDEFERINARPPSLKEIALVLFKSTQKMKKNSPHKESAIQARIKAQKVSVNQNDLAESAIETLESAETVVLDYLKNVCRKKKSYRNRKKLCNLLLSRF
eukprot:5222_1